jgi:N-sulfoglucosamine sulfohydrolase
MKLFSIINRLVRTEGIALATKAVILSFVLSASAQDAAPVEPKRPNILFITADDLGYDSPGCCGNKTPDITPNIDTLASQGLRFEKAYVTVSVCQPSRSVWITGRYPQRNGAMGFNPITQPMPMLGEEMKKAGYHTSLLAKVEHFAPVNAKNWDIINNDVNRDPEQYRKVVTDCIAKAQAEGKPFFIIANIHDPHRPFAKSPQDPYKNKPAPSRLYKPSEVDVPGYLCDVPEARQELSYYYNSVRRCDDTVASILSTIDSEKLHDNTVVLFASDNGAPLPFAKGSAYVQSDRTPLIIRWPATIKPGRVDKEHFVSGIDMMPTILDIAGGSQPDGMDGFSFLPVLKGEKQPQRDHVNVVFHRDQTKSFEQRAYHDAKYGYIYNEWVAWTPRRKVNFVADNNQGMFGKATDPVVAARLDFYLHRAPEELYDYSKDPFALHNLAYDPAYESILKDMRKNMYAWLNKLGDTCFQGYKLYFERLGKKGGEAQPRAEDSL